MRSLSIGLAATVFLALSASPTQAATLHKCIFNGAVTYQQSPCAYSAKQSRKEPTLAELNAKEK